MIFNANNSTIFQLYRGSHFIFRLKHILLLNIIKIGLDTNYNNWQGSSPVLLVDDTGENHRPATSHW